MNRKNNVGLAIGLVLTISASQFSHATTVGAGSVHFEFDTQPTSVRYDYAEGYFGNLDGSNAYFDADFSSTLNVGQSSMSATWDPATGNTTQFAINATAPSPDLNSQSSGFVNTLTLWIITTDVLSFSYDYDFYMSRDRATSSDWMSMGVQVEISSQGETFYTDYDPNDPSFRTNWAFFQPTDGQNIMDESGQITFSYGEPGVVRTWFVQSDVITSGRDFVGVVPVPATLPLFLCALGGLIGLRKGKRHPSTV